MTVSSQDVECTDSPTLSASKALENFPRELRRLALISRDVEEAAGLLAETAVSTDEMDLQKLDMLTQHLEGMAMFLECLLKTTVLTPTLEKSLFVENVKPFDLLQRLVELQQAIDESIESDVDLF